MKKILLSLVLLFCTLLVVVNLFGAWMLAGVLEKAIGAPVKVGRLHIGIFTSSLGLYDFKIKNPAGFHEEMLADIHEISVQYDLLSLFRGKVHLPRLRLDFGDVTVEKNAGGKVNLLALGAMKRPSKAKTAPVSGGGGETKPQEKAPAKAGAHPAMALQMDEVFVNIGKVRYVDSAAQPPVVKQYDLGIHNETFHDVTNAFSLVKGIVFLILRKVGLSSLTGNFDILVKEVSGELQSTFNQLRDKLLKE